VALERLAERAALLDVPLDVPDDLVELPLGTVQVLGFEGSD